MEMIDNIFNKFSDLRVHYEDQRKQLCEKLKPSFHELFKPLLDKHEGVHGFIFRAYTPYFNDGDPCQYTVNELEFLYPDTDMGGDYIEGVCLYGHLRELYQSYLNYKNGVIDDFLKEKLESRRKRKNFNGTQPNMGKTDQELIDMVFECVPEDINNVKTYVNAFDDIEALNESFLRIPVEAIHDMFGDHREVIITREGVDVRRYEHE